MKKTRLLSNLPPPLKNTRYYLLLATLKKINNTVSMDIAAEW